MALTLPFLTEADHAARAGHRPRVICEGVRLEGAPAIVFPAQEAAHYAAVPMACDVPAVTLTTHRHAAIRGRSNLLTLADGILRHGMIRMTTDIMPETFYQRLGVSDDLSTAAWAPSDPYDVGYLPEAAVFADGVAYNYAHWLTEVLPRVAVFVREMGAKVPLVVDDRLHPNIMRSLALLAGPDAVIHRLGPDQVMHVGVLHNVSAASYVPFKLKPQPLESIGHGVFHPEALQEAVRRLKAGARFDGPRPKLLLRRNASVRQLGNEPEIAEALIARGFEVIEPERLSFDDQVEVYGRAKVIVGATGAAMANLIFSQPDCVLVVLMARFRHAPFWYWRRMSAAAGAGMVVHVSGEQATVLPDPWDPLAAHQNYHVDVRDVLAAVETAEAH